MSLLTMPVRFCSDLCLCSMFVLLSLFCGFWLMLAGWLRRRERAGHLALRVVQFLRPSQGFWGFREKGYLFSGILGEGSFIFRDLGRKHNFLGF